MGAIHTRCPVCRRPILAMRVLFMPLWKRWDCPDCGSLLGVDRNRRFLGMIPWFVVLVVLIVVVSIMNYGLLVAIPTLILSMIIMLAPFSRPVVLSRGGFRCRTCGYDLEGQTEPKCPECGEVVAVDDMERFRNLRHGDTDAALARSEEVPATGARDRILIVLVIVIVAGTLAAGIVVYRQGLAPAPGPPPAAPGSAAPGVP